MEVEHQRLGIRLNLRHAGLMPEQSLELIDMPANDRQCALQCIETDRPLLPGEEVKQRRDTARDLHRLRCEILDVAQVTERLQHRLDLIRNVDPAHHRVGRKLQHFAFDGAVSKASVVFLEQLLAASVKAMQVDPLLVVPIHEAKSLCGGRSPHQHARPEARAAGEVAVASQVVLEHGRLDHDAQGQPRIASDDVHTVSAIKRNTLGSVPAAVRHAELFHRFKHRLAFICCECDGLAIAL
ncbi:hypothetical protein D3C86_1404450 [compost metagenome]